MDRLPLLGGSYLARSIIANAQRCVNLFPETNPKDSPVPLTHYQRPGLRRLGGPPIAGPGRSIWQASNGDGYCTIGNVLYYIDGSFQLHAVGGISPGLSTPTSAVDNGIDMVLVDGTASGWTIDLATRTMTPLVDPSFTGADRVDYIDTFVLWNVPGTRQFRSTLSNQITPMDPLYVASKTDFPDPLQTLIVNRHEILLLGRLKTEIWYDAGNPQFPFAELPGAYIEHGIVAKYSVASADIATYWLGQDLQGIGVVFRQRGYECKRISNHALEYAIRQMYFAGTIADAVGYTYQQDGHVFYVLQFPTGNQTWVWDESIEDPEVGWHQEAWTDPRTGTLNRHRANGYASLYGKQVVLDWENGDLYQLDLNQYTDEVAGINGPIRFIRTFPHLMSGLTPQGQPMLANGKIVQHNRFMLDAEFGTVDQQDELSPQFTLRYSDDRGRTYTAQVLLSAGRLGEYATRAEAAGLGMAMDRVYEVEYSYAGACALNGAWVEGKVMNR